MDILLWVVIAYLVGSIPFGLVLARLLSGRDPRAAGSGNVGATNVTRTCGKGAGALTLLCDLLKGLVLVAFAQLAGLGAVGVSLVALAAVCGHVFSCFLRFKGGKGVATTVGVLLPLAPWQTAVCGLLCLFIAWRTGFVSLGSLIMMLVLPILLLLSGVWALLPVACALGVLLFWTHRANIGRLRRREEKSWR